MTTVPLPARVAEIEAALADLLAQHTDYRVNEDGYTVCICGAVAEGDDDDGSHGRHLASVLISAGPLAELLATVREQADAIQRARALADEWVARMDPYLVGFSLRAVLPADHGQSRPCANCGAPLASSDEVESGLCLRCLNGPVPDHGQPTGEVRRG